MMESKYKDLKFDTQEEFTSWLQQTYKWHLEFEERGHDLMQMWTDERGEILHVEMAGLAKLYCGKFITENAKVGQTLEIDGVKYSRLIVSKISKNEILQLLP